MLEGENNAVRRCVLVGGEDGDDDNDCVGAGGHGGGIDHASPASTEATLAPTAPSPSPDDPGGKAPRHREDARGRRRAGFGRRTSSPPSSSTGGGLRRRHAAIGDDAERRGDSRGVSANAKNQGRPTYLSLPSKLGEGEGAIIILEVQGFLEKADRVKRRTSDAIGDPHTCGIVCQ